MSFQPIQAGVDIPVSMDGDLNGQQALAAFTPQNSDATDTNTQDTDQASDNQDAVSNAKDASTIDATNQLVTSQGPDPDTLTKENTTIGYLSTDLKPGPSPGDASNAQDLTDKQWFAVMQTNSLLYGFYIRERNEDVVRARRNAFVLKGSRKTKLVVPHFHVEDGSSIQVQETKNAFQRSLAHNAFSKRCIETNISAGDFGIMAGISGTHEKTKSNHQKTKKTLKDQEYYAVYNFPRARVFLDEEELELSEKCEAMLKEIEKDPTYDRLQRFYKLFGHVFVTSILLGGQQKTTKFAAALSKLDEDIQEDALRSAIGAKINAQYVAASSQISKETGQSIALGDQQYGSLSSLGINASGGDTLIGSDVSQWVRTVAPYKNWRVIENETAEGIHELIGKFPSWSHIPGLFRQITSERPSTHRTWSGKLSFMLNGRPLCWDGARGILRLYCPSESTEGCVKAIFKLDPAYTQGSVDASEQPKYDRPYFLSCGPGLDLGDTSDSSWARLSLKIDITGRASMSPEISIPNGESKNCRFSFRKRYTTGKWDPRPYVSNYIKHGDIVHLYCHSLGLGPFTDLSRPPLLASPATSRPHNTAAPTPNEKNDLDILFSADPRILSSVTTKTIEMYDTGKMDPKDMEVCTNMGMILPKHISSSQPFAEVSHQLSGTQQVEDFLYSHEETKKVSSTLSARARTLFNMSSSRDFSVLNKNLNDFVLSSQLLLSLVRGRRNGENKPVELTIVYE